jgi:hypothetical protein
MPIRLADCMPAVCQTRGAADILQRITRWRPGVLADQ